MKKFLRVLTSLVFVGLFLLTFSTQVIAQCGTANSAGSINPVNIWQTTSAVSAGSMYYWSFYAYAGETYQFSNCPARGGTAEDTYLRIYNSSWGQVAYADDQCGVNAAMETAYGTAWNCSTSGNYYVYLSHYSCNNLQNNQPLAYYSTRPSAVPQYLQSTSVTQLDTNIVFQGMQQVKTVQVTALTGGGSVNPLKLGTVYFSLGATTAKSDIKGIYLYSNNTTPLSTANIVAGPLTPDVNGVFSYTFPTNTFLTMGSNNLIVGFDLTYNAGENHILDVSCDSATIGDTMRYPTTPNPTGTRRIVHPSNYNKYCDVTRTSGLNYLIGLVRFTLNQIDQQSGVLAATGSAVAFYPTPAAITYWQKTYQMRIQHAAFNPRSAKLYVDWNNNGFFDGNELVKTYSNVQPATITYDNLTIPCTATEGFHRMRWSIGATYESSPSCGSTSVGEVEDYLLFIPPNTTPVVSFSTDTVIYRGGLTKFYPQLNMEGNVEYYWDFDNNSTWDSITTSTGTTIFNSTGYKIVNVKARVYRCTDTIESAIYTDTLTVVTPSSKPIVNFISNFNTVTPSITVNFNDLTTMGPHTWEWKIMPDTVNGNAAYTITPSRFVQEPSVQFHELGDYTVTLIATNMVGADSLTKVNYINVGREQIMCTDQSTDRRSGYLYDDGGKYNNYSENTATQVYQKCTYLIQPKCALSVSIDFLDFDICRWNSTGCPTLIAGDNLKIYDGIDNTGTPLHLNPKDILGSPLFPDGYQNGAGNASIGLPPSLTANSGAMFIEFNKNCGGVGTGFEAKWSTTIFTPNPPQSAISGPSSDYTMKTVTFNSVSTGYALDFAWDMNGDGWDDVWDSVASYQYTTPGTYNVRLVVTSCDFTDTSFHTIVITTPSVKPVVNFAADYVRVTKTDLVTFSDLSDNTVYDWKYTITPSTYSLQNNSQLTNPDFSVRFDALGQYTVKLVAKNAFGTDSITKLNYITVYQNCQPGVAVLSPDLGFSEVTLTNIGGDTLIHNISSIGVTAYTDYSASKVAELYKGGEYEITLKRNTAFNTITRDVYIDLNQDGQYSANESVANQSGANTLTWSVKFTIPLTANNGISKLRVVANAGILTNKGCGPNYSGEYEDYGLKINSDIVKPVITLTDDDTIILNSCGSYTEPGYFAWDEVSGNLTSNVVVTGVSSINPIVPAYYKLTYTVSDNAGNAADPVYRWVNVLPDIVPPTIILTGNNPDSILVKSVPSYTQPGYNATDNCSGIKNKSHFGTVNTNIVGVYDYFYVAEDNAGNFDTLIRKVVVFDSIPPSITLLGSPKLYIQAKTTFTDPGVTITDNYYNNLVPTIYGSVNTNILGPYFLQYCVTDSSGNGPVCVKREVVVIDTIAPTISFKPQDQLLIVDVGHQVILPDPDYSDNFYAKSSIIVQQSGTFNNAVLGDYVLTYIAIDESGNVSAPATITIRIVDRVAPEIRLLGSSLINVMRWKDYTDPGVTILDNYYGEQDLILHENDNGSFQNTATVGFYTYTWKVCDPSGNCSPEISRYVFVIEDTTGIEEASELNQISVYPNPANDIVNIELKVTGTGTIDIYNVLGEKIKSIYSGYFNQNNLTINVNDLSEGTYFIKLSMNDQVINKKFVISR